jgi:hypothetical protein
MGWRTEIPYKYSRRADVAEEHLKYMLKVSEEQHQEIIRQKKEIEALRQRLKYAMCQHSYDVDGVCELCGWGWDDNEV